MIKTGKTDFPRFKPRLYRQPGSRTRYFWKDEDRIARRNERHRLKLELREMAGEL